MAARLQELKTILTHTMAHIRDDQMDVSTLKEVNFHMNEIEDSLHKFHHSVEHSALKWVQAEDEFQPEVGATIPWRFFFLTLLDAVTDGFMIGVTTGLAPKAGFILGFANTLEMAFLGMALSSRLGNCTASSRLLRNTAILAPPISMFLSSG